MMWDGATLHVTQPVQSLLPVQVRKRIHLLHSDEFDFDPVFEMINEEADEKVSFKPKFQRA